MSYSIELTPNFVRESKILAKKYPSLKNELSELFEKLKENPRSGTSLGNDVFKIRLAIVSKGKGKSGGVRIISWFQSETSTIFLLSIYSKGSKDDISNAEIRRLLERYL